MSDASRVYPICAQQFARKTPSVVTGARLYIAGNSISDSAMNFRVTGLSATPFQHLFGLSAAALAERGVRRYIGDESGFPDRISLCDLAAGETVLLVNYEHQPANTPYRASHATLVAARIAECYDRVNEIPNALRPRLLSLRAFDAAGWMLDADVVNGANREEVCS
jgi:Protein of unknown function (DUF1203)